MLLYGKSNWSLKGSVKKESRNQVPHLTRDAILESDKTQENNKDVRAKELALSYQMIARLQGRDNTV